MDEMNPKQTEIETAGGENNDIEVPAAKKALGGELPADQTDGKTGDPADTNKETGGATDYKMPELPEGLQTDEAMLGAIAPVLREIGINQEQFSQLIGAYAKVLGERNTLTTEQAKQAETAQAQATAARDEQWLKQVMSDPEIGGKDWQAKVQQAGKIYDNPKIVSEGLREALYETGLNKHPEVVRLFCRLSKVFGNDQGFFGQGSGGMTKDEFNKLSFDKQVEYKNNNPNWKERLGIQL